LLDHVAGVAPIGVYPDGGHALYRFWRPGSGPVHDLIAGTTDAGKSRLLDQLLAYERHSPLMVSWVIDPQRGQSLPDWQDAVDWFADSVSEGKKLLKAAQREMYRRNKLLARMEWVDEKGRLRRGKASFTPTEELPLLCLTIEEAHAVLADPQNVKIVEDLAKMARSAASSSASSPKSRCWPSSATP
jgi:DNA segregation ATPase FtsK/SpoIIIE-like protein